jgi:small GTP-binding protein
MDYVFKIVIVGESGVGKTTMFRQFIDDPKKDETSHLTTIGVDFHHKTIVLEEEQGGEPRTVKLQLWDTAGQERFNALTKQYFNGTHGCVLVFDLSLPSTLAGLKRWADPIQHNDVERLILIGNKSDLQRVVTTEQIDAVKAMLCELQGGGGETVTYLETCSRTGNGVDKVFWQLAQELVAKCEPRLLSDGKAPVSPDRGRAINISETATAAAAKKKGCC